MSYKKITVADAAEYLKQVNTGCGVIPIGGCGEFGINMTLYGDANQFVIVDCGLMFPDSTKLGVDAIIPDVDELFNELGAPCAYLITHGHEDHIGALPYIYPKWPAPIYCTQWTAELLKIKFTRAALEVPPMMIMNSRDHLQVTADLTVDWIPVNHSIPHAHALLMNYREVKIVHTGDFKFDDSSLYEPPLDQAAFKQLLPSGCDLLVADSTNASSLGPSPSEALCLNEFNDLFASLPGRVFVTTFASNLWRIKSILAAAKASGKPVHFAGAGMEKTVAIARDLDMLAEDLPEFISAAELKTAGLSRAVIVCTGCQGEPMSALARIVRGEYRYIKLQPQDTVIFSSRVIPGSERQLYHMVSECIRQGVEVITPKERPNIHVSGHAYQGDLKRIADLVRPKNVLAVHGTFNQIFDHVDWITQNSSQSVRVVPGEDGVLYHLKSSEMVAEGQFDISWLYIDSFIKQTIDNRNLKQRLNIGELGLIIFSGVYSVSNERWVGEVFMELKGLQLPENIDPDQWHESCKQVVAQAVANALYDGHADHAEINDKARIALRQKYAKVFRKKVVVSTNVHRM